MSACFPWKLENELRCTSDLCQHSCPLSKDKCCHCIHVHFDLKFPLELNVLCLKEFCSAVLWGQQGTLFQKYVCLIVCLCYRCLNSSVEMGNVCSSWSLRSISWWLQWNWFQLIWVKSAGVLHRSTSEQSFQEEQKIIFHTVYIDEIKCNNASVKLIFWAVAERTWKETSFWLRGL